MGKIQYFGAGIQFDVWSRGRVHVQVDHQLRAIKMKKKNKIKYKDSTILSCVCLYTIRHIGDITIWFYINIFLRF